MTEKKAIQDFYPDDIAICYGCGRHNPEGLHIRTIWDGRQGIYHFKPKPYHTAFPGVVYGGMIASLIDCNSIGTAIAAAYDAEGRAPGSDPEITYVTGNLNVTYLHPAPIDAELVLRASVKEFTDRKALVVCSVHDNDTECARGEVVAIRVPSRKSFNGIK